MARALTDVGSAFAVEFSHEHTSCVSRELQTAIGIEVISLNCVHSIFRYVSSSRIELDSQLQR